MRRGDSLIKLVSFLVFLTLAIYIGYSAYQTRVDPFKTVLAVEYDINDGAETTGYFVRDEEPLSASGSVVITAEEGSKVHAYETVAAKYVGTAAIERAEQIRELKLELQQLENEKSGTDSVISIKENVLVMSKMLAKGNIANMDSVEIAFKSCFSSSADNTSIAQREEEIESLKLRISQLENSSSSDVTEIRTSKAGIFSTVSDGYENISIDDIYDMTPSEVSKAFTGKNAGQDVFGKIVYGIKWYYVTVMDLESALRLNAGETATVEFSKEYSNTLSMKVEKIGDAENGKCTVVFSCMKYVQNVAALRNATAEIVFSKQSGIKVPKNAIHLDEDGKTCVYTLEGRRAKQTYVTVLATEGDYYLVASDDGALRAGNQIIASGKGLYDGKVVA